MPLTWRPQLDTGNTLIDDDHKKLFALINAVEISLTEKRGGEHLTKALNSLYDYTNYHFEREEKIQRALANPGLHEHLEAHATLKGQLVELRKRIVTAAEAGEEIEDTDAGELTGLLRSWLVDHIVGMDLPLKSLLAKVGPGYSGDS